MTVRDTRDVVLHSGAIAIGNGTPVDVVDFTGLTIKLSGTFTSATVAFYEGDKNGNYTLINGVRKSDSVTANQTTTTSGEVWLFNLAGATTFRATIIAITGGNITIEGKLNKVGVDQSQITSGVKIISEEYVYKTERLDAFKTMLKTQSSSKKIVISVIGDSITEGGNSTNFLIDSYTSKIRDVLQSKFSSAGVGFLSAWRQLTTTPTYIMTRTGTWNTWEAANQGGIGATLTATFSGTGFDLIYFKGATAGTFTVKVDGGTAVPVTTSGALAPATYSITGLANASHTVVITNTHASQNIYIVGLIPTGFNSGVRVDNYGIWGTSVDRFALGTYKNMITYVPADLYVIAFTANDYSSQTPLSTYKANLDSIIKTFAINNTPVILLVNGLNVDPKQVEQKWYSQVLYELADSNNNVSVIDINAKWTNDANYAKATLGFISDNVHPTDNGHKDIANIVLKQLLK